MKTLIKLASGISAVLLSVIIWLLISLVTGVIVMYLWNWLMPDIFGLTTITYWQGMGLSSLCSILFKPTISIKK